MHGFSSMQRLSASLSLSDLALAFLLCTTAQHLSSIYLPPVFFRSPNRLSGCGATDKIQLRRGTYTLGRRFFSLLLPSPSVFICRLSAMLELSLQNVFCRLDFYSGSFQLALVAEISAFYSLSFFICVIAPSLISLLCTRLVLYLCFLSSDVAPSGFTNQISVSRLSLSPF